MTAVATDAITAYFQAIEAHFNGLRGSARLLGALDYQLVDRWHRKGLPLGFVLGVLEQLFAKRQERGATDQVGTLRYFERAVDDEWRRVRELMGPARRDPVEATPIADRLTALAGALPERFADWGPQIRQLAGGAEHVEGQLCQLDEALLEAAAASLSAPQADEIDRQVETIIDGLRDRFPDSELASLRAQLHRQRLRRLLALPVLTLFG